MQVSPLTVEDRRGARRGRGLRRLAGVDAARGVALLGMMAVHVLPGATAAGDVAVTHLVAGGRSAALFAVLAGVGLALATGGRQPLRGRAWLAAGAGVVVRALLIGAVGLGLGDAGSAVAVILAYYAVLFVLAVTLLGLGPRTLAAVAVAATIVVPALSHALRPGLAPPSLLSPTFGALVADPGALLVELTVTGYYPALAWVAYLAAGLAVGRLDLAKTRTTIGLLVGGAVLAVLAVAVSWLLLGPVGGADAIVAAEAGGGESDLTSTQALARELAGSQSGTTPTSTWWWLAVDAPHATTPPDLAHTTGMALAVLGGLLLLARGRWVGPLLVPLAAAGGMTLTIYTVHVLLLASPVLPEEPLTSYLVQVAGALVIATAWRRLVGRGPLEALVAALAGRTRRLLSGASGG